MSNIEHIIAPVKTEMSSFETYFKAALESNVPLLDKVTQYIVKRKGKQMRPLFVFLSSKLFADTNDTTFHAASLVELLHTATLVHDDVVDDANLRRGFFSINALWKNKIAVLVGDFLLSKGLLMSVENNQFELLRIVSKAVQEMSEGELLQMEKARRLNITEEVYYDIIRQKTASLIAACCAAGASSVDADEKTVDRMYQFGLNVGMAFQIKDDLFDYGFGKNIGKPTGIDIKERKMTLPLIYALNHAKKSERKMVINTIKNHNTDSKQVQKVLEFVQSSKGIDYSISKMNTYRDKALNLLFEMPESEAREALEGLVHYTINRER